MKDHNEDWNTQGVTLDSTYGGGSFAFDEKVTYLGHNNQDKIYTDLVTTITNNLNNVTCGDFQYMKVFTPTDIPGYSGTAGTWVEVLPFCEEEEGMVVISIPAQYGWEGDNEQVYNAAGKFAVNVAPATYTLTTKAMMKNQSTP